MDSSAPPGSLPQSGRAPVCWKALYAAEGEATVWVCGYGASAGALNAVQRMPAAANRVKFQKGRYFALAEWNGVSQASITALVRALERALPEE